MFTSRSSRHVTQPKDPLFPKIILFGDSLTERSFKDCPNGFGSVLENYYAERAAVQNWGFSGYNSTRLKPHFTSIIRSLQSTNSSPPLFITIFLGANDACLPPSSAHVPLPQYEANIRRYVDEILEHPMTAGTKVILITPPPISIKAPLEDEFEIPAVTAAIKKAAVEQRGYKTYMNKKLYAEKIMEIARDYEAKTDLVAGLNFWEAMIKLGNQQRSDEDVNNSAGTGKVSESRSESESECDAPPGSGCLGARDFGDDVFVDGLHLGPLVSNELNTVGPKGIPLKSKRVMMCFRESFSRSLLPGGQSFGKIS
ncbi:MAG: hypothetical protein M1837_003196 [Sclerophora amabilis]|nr:MAG: hypothetical protein M1837_003196 [Sclerophora amabilis]